ncbi:MAG: hypothetical protein ACLRVT_03290 [Oscillospiraceae bacterium]
MDGSARQKRKGTREVSFPPFVSPYTKAACRRLENQIHGRLCPHAYYSILQVLCQEHSLQKFTFFLPSFPLPSPASAFSSAKSTHPLFSWTGLLDFPDEPQTESSPQLSFFAAAAVGHSKKPANRHLKMTVFKNFPAKVLTISQAAPIINGCSKALRKIRGRPFASFLSGHAGYHHQQKGRRTSMSKTKIRRTIRPRTD